MNYFIVLIWVIISSTFAFHPLPWLVISFSHLYVFEEFCVCDEMQMRDNQHAHKYKDSQPF